MGYWPGSTDGSAFEAAGDYLLKTAATSIYIGHNPVTGEYLQGVLKAGEFDPGCRAH